jgi:cell division protein FtsQ
MMASPWLRSVSVRKELPDVLHILVKEAEPFALLDMKGRLFIVDDRGKMLEELRDSQMPFLPIISSDPYAQKEAFSEAINLARAVKGTGLLSHKDHIEIIAQRPQEMAMNIDGIVVKVGTGEYEDKLVRLRELEEEIKKRQIPVDYIDLRFANRVIVKPVNEVIR